MMGAPSVTWIFMLFVVLLVFGAIAAIIWRSWIVGGIVLALFLLVGLFTYGFHSVAVPGAMIAERTEPAVESEPNAEIIKTADFYPSLQDAAKYAAMRVYDNMQL